MVVSKDQGQSWSQANVPFDATLTAVFFLDDQLGWAVGHDGAILRTDNGGSDWQLQRLDVDARAPLLDIWFHDQDNGIAVGGNSTLLVSSDGGRNWRSGPTLYDPDEFELNLFAIAALPNGTLAVAAESGYAFRSTDLGETWQRSRLPYTGSMFGALAMENRLVFFGLLGHAFISADDGVTWSSISTGTEESLLGGYVDSSGDLFLVGMGGAVVHSADKGQSFDSIQVAGRLPFTAMVRSQSGDQLFFFGGAGVHQRNHHSIKQ